MRRIAPDLGTRVRSTVIRDIRNGLTFTPGHAASDGPITAANRPSACCPHGPSLGRARKRRICLARHGTAARWEPRTIRIRREFRFTLTVNGRSHDDAGCPRLVVDDDPPSEGLIRFWSRRIRGRGVASAREFLARRRTRPMLHGPGRRMPG